MSSAAQNDFINLPFQEKLEFLYGLPARQKRDLILASPEAERLVQSFAPDTLFYTLKEIGVADAGDLLSLAVPEQVRWLFDLDCWNKDRPDFSRMREWVEVLSESGRRRMAEALMALDLELVALLMRQYIRVYRLDDPQMLPEVASDHFVQFDEHYLVEFTQSDTVGAFVQEFIEEAFESDYNYFAGLMEEIYWGVEAELEEQAYQFRITRLADRGFPNYFDAQDVFSYVNPQRFADIRQTYSPPTRSDLPSDFDPVPHDMAPVTGGSDHSLFNTALTAGFAAQGKRQLRSEMATVTNQVLVARSVDFGDLDAVRVAVEMTHDYLNLALEHLAGGDLTAAIEHLRDTHLKLLFRLGVSLTIDLRKRAEATVESLGLAAQNSPNVAYLDSPYREALAGFLERQPRFFSALDRSGAVAMREFRTMRDLHLAYGVLDQIGAMPELFRALLALDIASPGFRSAIAGHEISLSQILLTACARYAMDRRLSIDPIEPERLAEMHAALMTRGDHPAHLRPEFHQRLDQLLEQRLDEATRKRAAAFVNSSLNMLEEEFGGLRADEPIDPRFVRVVMIRR
ncbi:MAG: hypothetical protein IVW54_09255 [Candidatus Binataceae bacterium]|nr:hypothetical protein [Candidatus Binataceae bacterium]